jgi:two-component system, OmpR family, sensor histidine kinase KdpD
MFVPLIGSQRTVGAIGVKPGEQALFSDPDQRRLLETCASLIALAIERDQSVLEMQHVQLQMEAEQLRNSLLSSVSHDLRTPLTAIAGIAGNLREELLAQLDARQQEMLGTLVSESQQLVRLVENLLDMARLESGSLSLNLQWHVLEELVGSAIGRLKRELANHPVDVKIPVSVPLLLVDGVLMQQVFINLLENASRYSNAGSRIEITARTVGRTVEVVFADNGPGLPAGAETKIFEKFFRATTSSDSRRGIGLGLAICRGIISAHGGRILAANRSEGGAEFVILMPIKQDPPQVLAEPLVLSAAKQ